MSDRQQENEVRVAGKSSRTATPLSLLVASGLGVALSVAGAAWASGLARGRNVSDVGVAMYENGAIASVVGTASYGVCAALTFVLVSKLGDGRCARDVFLPFALAGLLLTLWFLRYV